MDPENRMSMGQILSDPWVVENLDQDEAFRQAPKKKEAAPAIPAGDESVELSSSRSRILNVETSFKKILELHQLDDAPNKLPEKKKHFQSLTPMASAGGKPGVGFSAFGEALANEAGVTSPHSALVQGSQLFERKKAPVIGSTNSNNSKNNNKVKRIFDEKLLSPSFNTRLKNVFHDLNMKKSHEENDKDRLDGGHLTSFKIDSKASIAIQTPSKYFSIENSRENSEAKPSHSEHSGHSGHSVHSGHSGSVHAKYELEPVNLRKVQSSNNGSTGEERKILKRQIFQDISYQNHPKEGISVPESESKIDLPFGLMQGFNFLKDLLSGPSAAQANQEHKENSQPFQN